MIIRKKNLQNRKEKSSSKVIIQPKSNIIKKEDLINLAKKTPNEKEDLNNNPSKESIIENKEEENPQEKAPLENFEKIDITSIEFKERIERRRGDRRKGYRRIDERSLISRAQQEAHTIKELAAREGYQNGLKKAQGEIDELKNSLKEFLSSVDKMYEEFYPHIMELALDAAEKIIKKEVELSNDVLKEVVLSALDEINIDTQKITVRANEQDVEFLEASLPEYLDEKNLSVRFNIAADDSIPKGSCMIVADNGVIDASFTTQLTVLQNAFGIYKGGV